VRAALAALEAAVEARDVAAIRERISDAYRDAEGRDERALAGLATFHFMRNQAVYALVRVHAIEFPAPDRARVEAVVALAGTPIDDVESLLDVRADLHRMAAELADEDGSWRVAAAAWRPAALADLR
jgi:hypothetical protein